MRTTQHPHQQRAIAAPRLDATGSAMGDNGEPLLVALELGPIDVAFMVILEHHRPLLERLAMAVALS